MLKCNTVFFYLIQNYNLLKTRDILVNKNKCTLRLLLRPNIPRNGQYYSKRCQTRIHETVVNVSKFDRNVLTSSVPVNQSHDQGTYLVAESLEQIVWLWPSQYQSLLARGPPPCLPFPPCLEPSPS